MTSSPGSSPVLEEIITQGVRETVHLDGMSEPASSSGIAVTGGDDAIGYDNLATYVRDGNWDKTKRFLKSNLDGVRRLITRDGQTALHIAISCRHERIAKKLMLLMQKEDFLLRDGAGQTALHLAVGSRDILHEIFETLMQMISQEALGIQDGSGRTALHLAVGSRDILHEIFETLMQMMSQEALGIQDGSGRTALHVILKKLRWGYHAPRETLLKVRELIEKMREQDLELRDVDGFTALHYAAHVPAVKISQSDILPEIFETLMQRMSKEALGIQDASGRTALHIKLESFITDRVGWLLNYVKLNWLEKNAKQLIEKMREQDLALRDVDGFTALHHAIHVGDDQISGMFIEKMPQQVWGIQDNCGLTTLHHAAHSENFEIVEYLVAEMQQGMGIQDMDGNTPLHLAVSSGSVEMVKYLVSLMQVEDLGIQNADGLTALHMASFYGQVNMVEILVKAMKEQDLEKKENDGRTALSFAVVIGNIDMAKCMVEKNQNLLRIVYQQRIPVVSASATPHIEMMYYLYEHTPREELLEIQGVMLINTFILRKMFDFKPIRFDRFPLQATAIHLESQPLLVLAGMPSAFRSGSRLLFWQRWIYSLFVGLEDSDTRNWINSQICHALRVVLKRIFKYIYYQKKMNKQALKLQRIICGEIQTQNSRKNDTRKELFHKPLMEATKNGIYEIAHEIIYSDPSLFFEIDTHSRRMIELAILHRQEKIFSLIYGLHETSWAFFISHQDEAKNTMLHVAGMSPSNQLTRISGAALRMQRELQWFEEVERILDPLDRNAKNEDGKTAHELFTENHVKLVEDGEKWMKAMASSCTVVAALIVTIMFAAAFTVPGGNNENSGAPIFLQQKLFLTFIICDAISFFTSSASVLMFVVILTTRYSEEYFLEYLPRMMIIGLSSFFISIITMTVAFCAALFLMLRGQPIWVFLVIILFACVPIFLFLLLLFPLLLEMLTSTYGSSIFKKKKNLLTLSPFKMGVKHVTLQKSSTFNYLAYYEDAKMV